MVDASVDKSRDRSMNSLNRSNNKSTFAQVSRFGDLSKSRLNDSKSWLDKSRDKSVSMIGSPSRANNPNTISLRNLRKFDKVTGGFRDKDFTEEYSV